MEQEFASLSCCWNDVNSLIHLRHVHVINKAGNSLAHRRPVRILGAFLHSCLQGVLHIQRWGSRWKINIEYDLKRKRKGWGRHVSRERDVCQRDFSITLTLGLRLRKYCMMVAVFDVPASPTSRTGRLICKRDWSWSWSNAIEIGTNINKASPRSWE